MSGTCSCHRWLKAASRQLMEGRMKIPARVIGTTLGMVVCMVAGLTIWVGAQSPSKPATAAAQEFKTAWGEPDLQGIWSDTVETPLERPAKWGDKEFFTEQERADL